MRRTTSMLAAVALCAAAGLGHAQEDDTPRIGSVLGGLIGGAIGAAVSGRAPRVGDVVPSEVGGVPLKGKSAGGGRAAAGGKHPAAPGGGGAGERRTAQAGTGGQVRRKQGK